MKNLTKIFFWIIITLAFIIIYYTFIKKDTTDIWSNKIEVNTQQIPNEEIISQKYNQTLNSIWSLEQIDKCNDIKQENLVWMCKTITKDKFSLQKSFKDFKDCDKLKDTKENIELCKYNLAIKIINSKEEINLCNEIWNKTFTNMCVDIIKNRYK